MLRLCPLYNKVQVRLVWRVAAEQHFAKVLAIIRDLF